MKPLVLIVDDDPGFIDDMELLLGGQYRTSQASCLEDGRRRLLQQEVDLLLLDVHLGQQESGFELLDWVQETKATLPVLMVSDRPAVGLVVEAMRRGAVSFLPKSATAKDILRMVDRALGRPEPDEGGSPSRKNLE